MTQTCIAQRSHVITSVLCAILSVVFCSFSVAHANATTSLSYEFLVHESSVLQTGGLAGVYIPYPVEGGFRLVMDGNGGAVFQDVDAELGPPAFYQSFGELFNTNVLTGKVINDTTIAFTGLTQGGIPGLAIRIDATFQDNLVTLTGGFDENDLVWDGFRYDLRAVGRLAGTAIPGDTNGNDAVDERDYDNLIAQFGGDPGDESADFNHDGVIDLKDFVILRKNFGAGVQAAPGAGFAGTVPEPAALLLITAGLPAILRRKGKK
ncbi:MAG: hypothetical protein QGG42_00735 [Phycisphaerae bacterium]|jgi:hypothetical protein|nr:hypothetical protein [Phycisphaerae bacterium]